MKNDQSDLTKTIPQNKITRRQILETFGVIAGTGLLSTLAVPGYGGQADTSSEEINVRYFDSLVQAQKSKKIKEGELIKTLGYFSPGDGGAANYLTVRDRGESKINNGDIVQFRNGNIGLLTGITQVNYKIFGAAGDSKTDDGASIHMAHEYANRFKLPVENNYGEYWINQTRNIQIKTSVRWGQSIFHINEQYDTNQPVFKILSYDLPKAISKDESEKKRIIQALKPGVQEIPELSDYNNSLIVISDSNDRIGFRSGARYSNQSRAREELFYMAEKGKIIGDIAWSFNDYTELTAYPGESSYLTIEGGTFYLSGNPPVNGKGSYVQNGFSITRSRTIIKNQWVGLENGKSDVSMNPRNGFYSLNTVYDVTLENIKLLPFEQDRPGEKQDVPAGTYGIGGNRILNTTFRNISAEGTLLHWGVFGTNMNKNFRVENCRLNRVDVHFHCWNLTIKDSRIGNRGISITGGGELIIENSSCDNNRFVNFRADFGAKWDGNITIRNCRLRPKISAETSILYAVASDFDYGYPIGLAKTVSVENFIFDFRGIPECKSNSWLITSSSFSRSKKGKRSFFPGNMQFKNILTEGREKGLRLMKISDPTGYVLHQPGDYDGAFFKPNASVCFDNVQLEQDLGEDNGYHLMIDKSSGFSNDPFSLYPQIRISNSPSVSLHLGNTAATVFIENCNVHRLRVSAEKAFQGEISFVNCKFLPVIDKESAKPFQLSAELGTSFINCVFHLPRMNQKINPEALSLLDFIAFNKSVFYNHINSRLGNDVLNYYKSKGLKIKPDFISMLKSHHELEDRD